MTIKEIEDAALKLEPKARARLAEKLLDSLERSSDDGLLEGRAKPIGFVVGGK